MNIFKHIKSILFLCRMAFILLSELLVYAVFQDFVFFVDRLTARLASINILYVKIFQAVALNANMMDDQLNNRLMSFTDHAPWSYSDIDLKQLNEMALKYNIQLPFGYEVPINAGMISLVFKGYNGTKPVIIKMKRKHIQTQLDEAIEHLLFTVYLLSFIPIIERYQLSEVVHKNIDIIRHQTNFAEEIENMERVRENCKYIKYVKIPTANKAVTNEYPNIILMDYIDGVNITRVKPDDYEPFAKLVVKFGIVTTLIHGVTHGDLHSGNILFIKDPTDHKCPYKLGIIDFGIVCEVGATCKGALLEVCTQMFEKPPRELAVQLLHSGLIHPPHIEERLASADYEAIVSFTGDIIADTIRSSKSANQTQLYKFISTLKDYLSRDDLARLGIRPSDEFVKLQLVLAMSHGVTLSLCKDKFITLMDQVINELFHIDVFLQYE